MTQLLLIRHGQASFGTADYDRLSALGARQARLVGRQLAHADPVFDGIIAGAMRRQVRSAEIAAAAGLQAPPLMRNAAFNEYDPDAIFAAYLPRVLAVDRQLADAGDALWRDRRLFQRAFEGVTRHWIEASPDDTGRCEPWPDFCARVHAALDALHTDYDRTSRIAVFTSGGPIAVAMATAVEASAAKTIELNWSIRNGAITELRSTRHGWRLSGFNDVSALRAAGDPRLLTYR